MESFQSWTILDSGEFTTAQPRSPGELGVEVMAQVRPTGRFMDHMRLALGGSKMLQATFSSKAVFPSAVLPDTLITIQKRPEDVIIKRNTTTSEWMDLNTLIKARDALAHREDEEEDDTEDLLELMDALADPQQAQASIRWAVCATPDRQLQLVLQSLPAPAAILNSKPLLKG
jgi:hypothetical protein